MRGKRFKEEQIITVLKEAEAGIGVADLCRKHGICDGTFYNWKAKYGGLTVSESRQLKVLEEENRRILILLSCEKKWAYTSKEEIFAPFFKRSKYINVSFPTFDYPVNNIPETSGPLCHLFKTNDGRE